MGYPGYMKLITQDDIDTILEIIKSIGDDLAYDEAENIFDYLIDYDGD